MRVLRVIIILLDRNYRKPQSKPMGLWLISHAPQSSFSIGFIYMILGSFFFYDWFIEGKGRWSRRWWCNRRLLFCFKGSFFLKNRTKKFLDYIQSFNRKPVRKSTVCNWISQKNSVKKKKGWISSISRKGNSCKLVKKRRRLKYSIWLWFLLNK